MMSEQDAPELMQLLQENRQYSTLASALEKTRLAQNLNGPFTLLAPTNSAFEKLDKPVSEMSNEKLTKLLRSHILTESYTEQELTQQSEVESVSGKTLKLGQQGTTIGDARITDPGMKAQNGVVHGIDAVISQDQQAATSADADSTEF